VLCNAASLWGRRLGAWVVQIGPDVCRAGTGL
jgi:hypothetical protein